MSENFANFAATALAAPLAQGATAMQVVTSSPFPAAPFRVQLGSEILYVSSVAGTTWTVARGQESTAQPLSYPIGTQVQAVATAATLESGLPYVPAPASPTEGDSLIYDAGTWTRLPVGSAGQTLGVAAGKPAWVPQGFTSSTVAGLSAIPDAPLNDGQRALVTATTARAYWVLSKTSTLTADATTVVATQSGTGRWILESRARGGPVPVTEVGADPTGSVDSLAAVNAAASALSGTGVALLFTGGTFNLSALPTIPANLALRVAADASFTGAGGTAFAAIVGALTQYQGGTVSAPATTQAVEAYQPIDATKPTFQYTYQTSKFNSTWDVRSIWGWNSLAGGQSTATTPFCFWGMEENYEQSPGVHWMEIYLQLGDSSASTHVLRPIYWNYNRSPSATFVCNTEIRCGDGSTDAVNIGWQNSSQDVVLASFPQTGTITLGLAGRNIEIDGAWLNAPVGGNITLVSTGGYAQMGGVGHFYHDADTHHFRASGAASVFGLLNASGLSLGVPLGGNGAPLVLGSSTGVSAATSFALSAAQQATPIIQLTGTVPAGGTTITLPNTVGSVWKFSLSAVTLSGTLTFTTGSGTTAQVTSSDLGTHKRLIEVAVTASNVVDWG